MCSVYFLPRLVALQCVCVMCLRLIKYIRYLVQFTLSVSAFLLYFLLLYLVACLAPLDIFQVANRSTCFRCQIRRHCSRSSPRRRGKGLDHQHCEDKIRNDHILIISGNNMPSQPDKERHTSKLGSVLWFLNNLHTNQQSPHPVTWYDAAGKLYST